MIHILKNKSEQAAEATGSAFIDRQPALIPRTLLKRKEPAPIKLNLTPADERWWEGGGVN